MLIEGAPGIGKSMLLKEMAYRWGKKDLLKTFKLVLIVCLRNPTVQQTTLIKDFFQLFCKKGDIRASLDCSSGAKISVSSLVTVLLLRTSCNDSSLGQCLGLWGPTDY